MGDSEIEVVVTRNTNGDALITSEADGKGFKFKYGPTLQYSQTYAKFNLKLLPDLKISDFESVTFTCQTNANYWGKKMAVIAAPKSIGLPSEFQYDYNSGAITPVEVAALSTNNFLPPSTMDPTPLTMIFDKSVAETLEGDEFECSVYIHMEHLDGEAEYIISDIVLNPHEGVTVNIPEVFYDAVESIESTEAPYETEAVVTETTISSETSAAVINAQTDTPPENGSNPLILVAIGVVLIILAIAVVLIRKKK